MSLPILFALLVCPLFLGLTSPAIAGQGSGAGSDGPPTALGFALPEPVQGSYDLIDGLREQIRADIQFRGGVFSAQEVTWENGRKVELFCGEFKGFTDEGKAENDLNHLWDLPLQPGFPRDWRGKCVDSRPLIPDAVRVVSTGSCEVDVLVDEVKYGCQGDMNCSLRLPGPNDQAILAQGWKQLAGTANFYRCP